MERADRRIATVNESSSRGAHPLAHSRYGGSSTKVKEDDQPANLLALEAVLDELEQDLVRAKSGDEVLLLLHDEAFAIILLDVHMGGLDGFKDGAAYSRQPQIPTHADYLPDGTRGR